MECKFTVQCVRLRLELQYILGKHILPLHGKLWIQVRSQDVSNHHNPELEKNFLDRFGPEECQEFHFLTFLYCKPLRENRIAKFKFGDKICVSSYDLRSRSAMSHSLHRKFKQLYQFPPESSQKTQ